MGIPFREKINSKRAVIIISILLIFLTVFSNLHTFDQYFHMSCAEHYSESWFSLINPEIGTGIDLSNYPPLFHQLNAALSSIMTVKTSFSILTAFFLLLLSYNATEFLLEYFGWSQKEFWILYALIFSNIGLMKIGLTYGMATTLAGLSFGFIALRLFLGITRGEPRRLTYAMFTMSLAITGFLHHFSFLILCMLLIIISAFEINRFNRKKVVSTGISVLAAAILLVAGILPFISGLLTDSVPQKEISHPSRNSISTYNSTQRKMWLYSSVGLSFAGFLAPLMILAGRKFGPRMVKAYLTGAFFFILGLGRTTSLPEIVFQGLAHWLTYGRFLVISALILSAPTYLIIRNFLEGAGMEITPSLTTVLFVILIISANFFLFFRTYELFHGRSYFENSYRDEVNSFVIPFLNQNGSENYRFQTFGYGYRTSGITLHTEIPTTDNEYYTARKIPWIMRSGQELIDKFSEKYTRKFIRNSRNLSVRYIITFNRAKFHPDYNKIMEETVGESWKKRKEKDFGEFTGIIWEDTGVEPFHPVKDRKNYLWGTIPVFTLAAFVLITAYKQGIRG